MQQGLILLIQWVLEFAPVIADLVQKRNKAGLAIPKYQQLIEIQEFGQNLNGSIPRNSGISELEQEKFLQQQLAIYQRETQLKIAEQERKTALELPEIHKIIDNWPLRLYPSQILDHNSHRPIPLKILLAPPKV